MSDRKPTPLAAILGDAMASLRLVDPEPVNAADVLAPIIADSVAVTRADCRRLARGTCDQTDATRAALAPWRHRSAFLLLSGSRGTGKTVAACAALLAALRAGPPPAERGAVERWAARIGAHLSGGFVSAPTLPMRLAPWKDERERHAPINLQRAFLVLDDLGTERPGSRFAEAFGRLVDRRQAKATIITTNLAPSELRARYGDRVADRLNHGARVQVLRGASMRREGAGI